MSRSWSRTLRAELRSQADQRAREAATTLRQMSEQLRTMAGSIEQDSTLASLSRQASESTRGFAERLEQGGIDRLGQELARKARERPGTFLLGCMAAGVLVGRVIRDVRAGGRLLARGHERHRPAPGRQQGLGARPRPPPTEARRLGRAADVGRPDRIEREGRVVSVDTDLREDVPLGELVSQLTDDLRELATAQVQLAKVELQEEVARAKEGAVMFGAAALAGWLTVTLLSFAAAWGLAEVMPPGWAFLIVGLMWATVAALAFVRGRARMQQVEAVPETMTSIKEDARWARRQMR